MSEKVTIEMTREHAQVVQDACEMLMRLKLGQTMFPTELMMGGLGSIGKYDVKEFCLRRDIANDVLRAFLRAVDCAQGTEKDRVEQMAYEVWGTLRHAMWKAENPDVADSWDVRSQLPLSESGLEMPKCEVGGGNEHENAGNM